MKIKFCSCRMCRRNRRTYHDITRNKIKSKRSQVKQLLREGEYEKLPYYIAGGYTD